MNEFLNLHGYGPMLAQGAWMTLKLAFQIGRAHV